MRQVDRASGRWLASTGGAAVQVAVQLGLKVYLEADKWQVLQCLDMRRCERALLTRNINEAAIHVVPMRRVRPRLPLPLTKPMHALLPFAPFFFCPLL